MVVPHTWHFAIESTQPFKVDGTDPEPGMVGATLTATLAISFNKRLLPGSEGQVSFDLLRLEYGVRQPVAGQVTIQGQRLHFTPAAPLQPGAVYQARVVGAHEAPSGNATWATA